MERTIGGKPLKEVFSALRAEIPGVVKYTMDGGKPYLDVDTMRKHFNTCIPIDNYDFSVTDVSFYVAGKSACFTCTGTITVYDDCGVKVVSKSYTGSENATRLKGSDEFHDLAMSAKNAAVAARKNCISLFGCGEQQISEAKAKEKAENRKNNSRYTGRNTSGSAGAPGQTACQNQAQNTSPESVDGQNMVGSKKPPFGTGVFRLRYNGSGIKEYPKMVLIPVECLEYRNYKTLLLVWRNKADFDSIVNEISTGVEFFCQGKYEPYNNDYRIVLADLKGGAS